MRSLRSCSSSIIWSLISSIAGNLFTKYMWYRQACKCQRCLTWKITQKGKWLPERLGRVVPRSYTSACLAYLWKYSVSGNLCCCTSPMYSAWGQAALCPWERLDVRILVASTSMRPPPSVLDSDSNKEAWRLPEAEAEPIRPDPTFRQQRGPYQLSFMLFFLFCFYLSQCLFTVFIYIHQISYWCSWFCHHIKFISSCYKITSTAKCKRTMTNYIFYILDIIIVNNISKHFFIIYFIHKFQWQQYWHHI